MRYGVYLPTFDWSSDGRAATAAVARAAEDSGFDSIWVAEHMLPAPPAYATALYSPMMALSFVAAVTDRVMLGPGILVATQYHPVRMARDIATIQTLSNDRFILGVGPGWSKQEFDSLGIDHPSRGKRLDEWLAAVKALLSGESSFKGKFYDFKDVRISPLPKMPPIWAAGRSPNDVPGGQVMPAVLRRITASDRWFSARLRGSINDVTADWEHISRETGQKNFTFYIWAHVVDTNDRAKAIEEQKRVYHERLGDLTKDELEMRCLLGTPDDMATFLADLKRRGMDYVTFSPASSDAQQVELLARHVMPALEAA